MTSAVQDALQTRPADGARFAPSCGSSFENFGPASKCPSPVRATNLACFIQAQTVDRVQAEQAKRPAGSGSDLPPEVADSAAVGDRPEAVHADLRKQSAPVAAPLQSHTATLRHQLREGSCCNFRKAVSNFRKAVFNFSEPAVRTLPEPVAALGTFRNRSRRAATAATPLCALAATLAQQTAVLCASWSQPEADAAAASRRLAGLQLTMCAAARALPSSSPAPVRPVAGEPAAEPAIRPATEPVT